MSSSPTLDIDDPMEDESYSSESDGEVWGWASPRRVTLVESFMDAQQMEEDARGIRNKHLNAMKRENRLAFTLSRPLRDATDREFDAPC